MQSVPAGAASDTGLRCFSLIARFIGVDAAEAIDVHLAAGAGGPTDASAILALSKAAGIRAKVVRGVDKRLDTLPLPAMLRDRDGAFFVLARLGKQLGGDDAKRALIHEAHDAQPKIIPVAALRARLAGEALVFATRKEEGVRSLRFDFSWFIPALLKYRALLGQVLLASFVVQLLALVTPLFFQVVTDKGSPTRACRRST